MTHRWPILVNIPLAHEKTNSLLLLAGVFYKCQLVQVGRYLSSGLLYPYYISGYLFYQLLAKKILKSLPIIVFLEKDGEWGE